MAKLIYAAIASLDGYIADANGLFDWSAPDEQVHAFVNDIERGIGTHLYGRRMYEVMQVWQTLPVEDEPAAIRDFARIWRAADKVVYSTTLTDVHTPRTRLERSFDVDSVRSLKQGAERDVSVGGAVLAAAALRAGLVDECHFFLSPVVIGGGSRFLPDGLRLDLDLVDERRFTGGAVHLHYRLLPAGN